MLLKGRIPGRSVELATCHEVTSERVESNTEHLLEWPLYLGKKLNVSTEKTQTGTKRDSDPPRKNKQLSEEGPLSPAVSDMHDTQRRLKLL